MSPRKKDLSIDGVIPVVIGDITQLTTNPVLNNLSSIEKQSLSNLASVQNIEKQLTILKEILETHIKETTEKLNQLSLEIEKIKKQSKDERTEKMWQWIQVFHTNFCSRNSYLVNNETDHLTQLLSE